jgi:alkylation response protein AidB-like acyl-CoA dehydrogenase
MDFRLTDEQRMLRRTIRDLVDKEIKPRAPEWDRNGQLPWDNIRRLAEIDVTGLTIPVDYGGAGQSLLEGVFAIEEVARGCPNTALALISGIGVVSLAIVQYGTEAQKRKYLPPIAAGTAVSAICMTEPTAGSATSHVQTNAARRGDHWVVTGRKCMISRGGLADYYLVVCRFEGKPGLDGVGAVIIDRGTPGLSFGKAEDTLGFRGVPATDMIMEECPIPPDNVLVGAGGFKKMMTAFNAQRCLNPAISLGIAQAALEESLAYVQKRELYGHAVSDFQGIRWHLADMATKVEAALPRGIERGDGIPVPLRVLGGQAVRERDGAPGDGPRPAVARRLRLQPRVPGRAPAPRGPRDGAGRWAASAATQHDRRRADQTRIPLVDLSAAGPRRRAVLDAPVAQLDRASDFESEGRRFDPCQAHQ